MKANVKKIAKVAIAIALALACGGGWFYATVGTLVKPEVYEKQVLQVIKGQTGLDAKLEGKAKLFLFPTPKLVLSGLEISKDTPATPKFSANNITLYISASSIISGEPRIEKIYLASPRFSLQRAQDGKMYWSWLKGSVGSMSPKTWSDTFPVIIEDGEITYEDSFNDQSLKMVNIKARGTIGSRLDIRGGARLGNNQFVFSLDNKAVSTAQEAGFPMNIAFSANNNNYIKIESAISQNAGVAMMYGKISGKTDDVEQWLPAPPKREGEEEEENENARQAHPGSAKSNNGTALPLSLAGDLLVEGGNIKFSKVELEGLNSKGAGSADIYWKNWYPTIAMNIDFAELDYDMWKRLLKNRIGETGNIEKTKMDGVRNYDFRKENPIPQNIELNVSATAKKVISGKQEWGESQINAVLENGLITVNQCDVQLTGGGLLSLFGVLSQGGSGELRFQGNLEAKGKSLKQAISMFNNDFSDIPEYGLGEFTAAGNLFINAKQLSFSEAKAILEGTSLAGEIVYTDSGEPNVTAKLRIKDLNFDAVRDSLRRKKIAADKQNSALDYGLGFEWLKNLRTKVEAKVFADGFTFLEKKGSTASFSVFAQDGVFKLQDAQLKYPDYTSGLNFTLNMNRIIPALTLTINADQIDTGYFSLNPEADKKAEKTEKPVAEKDLAFDWMDGFSGVFDISLRKVIHRSIVLDNVKMQSILDGKQMKISNLSFVFSQAQTELSGNVYGGKIPGLSVRFSMSNSNLHELIKFLIGIDNISGYANISGTIATSGHNLKEWLAEMDGKFLLAARNVMVNHVNIVGVSNVVSVSRNSADVVNNVNNVLTKGATEFAVDGSVNIAKGEMQIPSISVKSGLVLGKIVGGINLSSMMLQLSALFSFANLPATTPPTMIVQLSGELAKPEMKVDTSALEAYVAKRSVKEK